MYSIDGLRNGIRQAKTNIKSLKKAIEREESTIADYKIMIDDIERAEKLKAEAEANVNIEIEVEDGGT